MSTKPLDALESLDAVWAARLELRLRSDTEEFAQGFRGAYTTVLVRCKSVKEYVDAVTEHVQREGFDICGIEELRPLSAGHLVINNVIQDLFEQTRQYPVQWSTFHMFRDDEPR
jgi:hypothetical protein